MPYVQVERSTVTFEKAKVEMTPVRSAEGVIIAPKANPDQRLGLMLFHDNISMLTPPLKGSDLDAAIEHLRQGA